jgi:hypothetical protein
MRRLALALLAAVLLPAAAEARSCAARVNGQELILVPEAMEAPAPGLRERMLMWPQRTWNRAWGARTECDSAAVIHFLARSLQLDQTEGYCLADGDEAGWLLVPGARNWRGRCTVTACDRVNAAAGAGAGIARTVAALATGGRVRSMGDGVQAVAHGTGAMLLTGQGAAVAATLAESAASVSAAVAAAPAAAAGTAVTVVAIGGAVWLCSD